MLQVQGLTKSFGGLTAVSDVTFDVSSGEIVGLIGPNGAGKTTCFNVISGFFKPTKGRIIFKGEDITALTDYQRASNGVVRTFQHTSLFPKLNVLTNIVIGAHTKRSSNLLDAIFNTKKFRLDEKQLWGKAEEILEIMKMTEIKEELAGSLAYGDQRRLEIAIALASDPELLLLDEPAAGMNPTESVELMQLIKSLQANGITILIVDHDMKVVMEMCDRIVVINYGKKIAEGIPKQIAENQEVISVYLGNSLKKLN